MRVVWVWKGCEGRGVRGGCEGSGEGRSVRGGASLHALSIDTCTCTYLTFSLSSSPSSSSLSSSSALSFLQALSEALLQVRADLVETTQKTLEGQARREQQEANVQQLVDKKTSELQVCDTTKMFHLHAWGS